MYGQAALDGQPTHKASGSATNEPSKWMSAVSSALSVLDLTRAFQLACSSAPKSTAATTPQPRLMTGA